MIPEKVDKNAKESLNLEETVFKVPYVNFKPFINEFVSDKIMANNLERSKV